MNYLNLPRGNDYFFFSHMLVGASMLVIRVYHPIPKTVNLSVSFGKLLLENFIFTNGT